MSTYLYNGVQLPQLPSWNKTLYPYALIQKISYEDGGYISHLRYSNQPFYCEASVVTNTDGAEHFMRTVTNTNTSWSKEITPDEYVDGVKLSLPLETVVWCNVDILDDTGTLYLAASEPKYWNVVFDLKSWIIGYNLGVSGKVLPFVEKNRILVKE